MKKLKLFLICFAYLQSFQLCSSSFFAISVPQEFLAKRAELVLYMTDCYGNSCVGICRLDNSSASRKISQCELLMTTDEETSGLCNVIDLMSYSNNDAQKEVVLHFEFDNIMNVLRILVLKQSESEDDRLYLEEIQGVKASDDFEADEFDFLSDLAHGVDSAAVNQSNEDRQASTSIVSEYLMYVELFALMQYGKAKRTMRDVSSWWHGNNN